MSVPTALPAKPTIATGGKTWRPATSDAVQGDVDAAQPGDRVLLPAVTINKSVRLLDKHDVTIELQAGTVLTGGGKEGVYVYRCNSIRITGNGTIKADDSGIGIYSGSGHVIDGSLTIKDCGAMGILVNTSDGTAMDRIWIEGANISNCGNSAHSPGDAEYWKYGLHCIYFGGGRDGHCTGVIVNCHIHDQPNGYGIQLGGQSWGTIVSGNLIERITGASAGGPRSDMNARGVQVFSSYKNSKDNLIVSNVFRVCPGAPAGSGPPAGVQGVVRDNVEWQCGPWAYRYGTNLGLTDGGNNKTADVTSVAAALDAGYLDVDFVPGSHTDSPPPTDTMPVTSTPNSDGTITLHWTPVTGAGYELWIDGVRQKSFSRDQTKPSWKVAKLPGGPHKYEVRAVGYGASGSVTL